MVVCASFVDLAALIAIAELSADRRHHNVHPVDSFHDGHVELEAGAMASGRTAQRVHTLAQVRAPRSVHRRSPEISREIEHAAESFSLC